MADTVQTHTLHDSKFKRVIAISNLCDTTGETDVVKVDHSGDTVDGLPTKYGIEAIQWNVQGFTSVEIAFDATADDTAFLLGPGSDTWDLRDVGAIIDPLSTGTTGDITVTTAGNAAGDTYNIILYVRKYR